MPRDGEALVQSPGVCAEALLPSAVSVVWDDVASDAKLLGTADPVTLVVTNVSDRAMQVRSFIELELDAGEPGQIALGTAGLAPGETFTTAFSLSERVPPAIRAHSSSRGIQATAEVMDGEGHRLELVHAPPIFYHWDADTLLIYGEHVLHKEMNHGLWGAPAALDEDEARFVRRAQVWSKD
ncbi:hypothetical protein [Nannocystis bainbridge]|uniref:Uncharacterized protein n=1 Tax=Nannocystis bainbridge TaxID=2995303 RepID=A0ABT5E4U4_9BACT|nr:hypothetical protein [Nannocystis bainbridge]MDC0720354.1 hypothetical protein [Nannocystis bainbridge]